MLRKLRAIRQRLRERKRYEQLMSKLEKINTDEICRSEREGFPGRAQQVLGGSRR